MDGLSVGQKIALHRRRKGMSQVVFAGLCGRTENWASKVETGRIEIDRLSVLRRVADVLQIPVSILISPDLQVRFDQRHELAKIIEEAIGDYGQYPDSASTATVPPNELLCEAADTYRVCQDGEFWKAGNQLSGLIRDIEKSRRSTSLDKVSPTLHQAAAITYLASEFTLTKLGEPEIAWLAAERSLTDAEQSGDLGLALSAQRAILHALQANERHEAAVHLAMQVSDDLRSRGTPLDPRTASAYGTLQLGASMAAARLGRRSERNGFIAEAQRMLEVVPQDANHLHLAFGPTNVQIHQRATAFELGDMHDALTDRSMIVPDVLPLERHVRHYLTVTRALVRTGNHREATDLLFFARHLAPWQVDNHFLTRGIVTDLLIARGRPSAELLVLAKASAVL